MKRENIVKLLCSGALLFLTLISGLKLNAAEADNALKRDSVFNSHTILARTLIDSGNFKEALLNANLALEIAQENNTLQDFSEAYKSLSLVYESLSNHEKSLNYFKLYHTYRDSIYDIEKEEAALNMAALKNLAQTEKDLGLLKQEKEFQENVISYQKGILIVAAVIILFILIIVVLLHRNNASKEKLHKRLNFKTEAISRQNQLLVKQKEEIVRQRDKIQLQADNLREINALKNKLFSIIGHDLRSPFSQLKGMFILLDMKVMKPKLMKEVLDGIKKNTNHLSDMLENLLAWSKSQMDRITPLPCETNLINLSEGTIELLKENAHNKGIKIENNINKQLVAFADPDMIELVLRNILSNAIKFCCKGDTVYLDASKHEQEITVSIKDTGVGMDAEAMKKIFTLQTYTTLGTNKEKGTGLGMHLCFEFVKQNGGRIWVESEKDEGSTFYFTIPAAQTKPPKPRKKAPVKITA